MKQQRIFQAIGGADPALLERSEHRRTRRRGWAPAAGALAACAALALALGRASAPVTPPEPEVQPPQEEVRTTPLRLAGQEGGTLHLLAVRCGAAPQATEREFILYFNQEMYQGAWEDGVYTVRPLTPLPEDLPACELTVEHLKNRSPSRRDPGPRHPLRPVDGGGGGPAGGGRQRQRLRPGCVGGGRRRRAGLHRG